MKRIFRILALSVVGLTFLSGCGKSKACSDAKFLGSWKGSIGDSTDIMTLKEDCTGTSSYCASKFDFPSTTESSDTLKINITETSGKSGCLPKGETSCFYSVTATSLTFSCTGGLIIYDKM